MWVNGKEEGTIKGAFIRGIFDISSEVKAGESATLAVLVHPQPHPGNPHEHTIANGTGHNGGITAMDGPTFLCTIGWDWIPGIRDRDTGIWQKVFLSASGPVLIQEPLVTTDVALPGLESADVKIQATLKNVTDQPQSGILRGTFGDVAFQQSVSIDANSTQVVTLDPSTTPQLHLQNPRLWWPNGYGPQNLYPVHLAFEVGRAVSDATDFSVGVRKVTYTVPGTDNLTVSVNGVPIMCKGGDWGMDEAMKRIPRERLEAQIRMHQLANYTIIRNWVGQSTSEDFYELCDKYGIMLWDEFFQPSPFDGDNPADLGTYLANARDKIVRFRNHPSIVIWCGRNEGYPPENVNEGLKKLMADLEPTSLYQPSSTNGHGVHSGGPYIWRTPQDFYHFDEPFKTEIGSVSVPTLESVQAMMPKDDWESINDDWAEHHWRTKPNRILKRLITATARFSTWPTSFAKRNWPITRRSGPCMKDGLPNCSIPPRGVIDVMSNPAQPSFVWQIYSWDLEPNASFFAVKKACEPVHVMLNEDNGHVEVINNHSTPLSGAKATVAVYNLDGTLQYSHDWEVEALASEATDLGAIDWPGTLSNVHFIKVVLQDAQGQVLSDNFYWRGIPDHKDDLQDLDSLPTVKLDAQVTRHDRDGKCLLDVTMTNPSNQIALMAHVQLRRETSGERVLPVYYTDNYLSFVPHETKTLTIEAGLADLKGEKPLIVVDGWNIDVTPATSADADVALNKQALVSSWPVTGLPNMGGFKHPLDQIKVNCGGGAVKDFVGDAGNDGGSSGTTDDSIDCSALGGPGGGLSVGTLWRLHLHVSHESFPDGLPRPPPFCGNKI